MDDKSTSAPINEEEQSEETTDEIVTEEVVENEPVEEVEEVAEEAEPAEAVEEEVKEDPKPPSKRENLRIQELVQKLKQPAPQQAPQRQDAGLDYRNELNADDGVYEKLETDRRSHGETQFNKGVEQAKSIQFETRLEVDTPKVISKYDQFNKDHKDFNPAVANAVNQMYLATAGYDRQTGKVQNTQVRYSDYVDGIMEMADEIAGEKVQASTKNIAKQAAVTGVRPDGSKAKRLNLDQAPEDMSDEELKTFLARAYPKQN